MTIILIIQEKSLNLFNYYYSLWERFLRNNGRNKLDGLVHSVRSQVR